MEKAGRSRRIFGQRFFQLRHISPIGAAIGNTILGPNMRPPSHTTKDHQDHRSSPNRRISSASPHIFDILAVSSCRPCDLDTHLLSKWRLMFPFPSRLSIVIIVFNTAEPMLQIAVHENSCRSCIQGVWLPVPFEKPVKIA